MVNFTSQEFMETSATRWLNLPCEARWFDVHHVIAEEIMFADLQ